MAVANDVLVVLRNALKELYESFFGNSGKSSRLSQLLTIVIVFAGIGYGGLRVYRWYTAGQEAKAQKEFSEAMYLYLQATAQPDNWEDVAGAFALGYEHHRNSNLAPFFKFFEAEALLEQGKREDAIKMTQDALNALEKNNPYYSFYAVKLALMKMESSVDEVRQEGLMSLEEIGSADSGAQDMASYYLGDHYWENNELKKAQDIWKKVIAVKSDDKKDVSPYVELVKQKLKQIG